MIHTIFKTEINHDQSPSIDSIVFGAGCFWGDPLKIPLLNLLKIFWECHDPTQGMRQGNDVGSQYRSVCYCDNEDSLGTVKASMDQYQKALQEKGLGVITTEIKSNQPYFFAEEYHQQYLDKNPNGYCGIGGTGCEFQA